MRPLGDGFIKLIKMMIAPIVFCTIVAGIGKMADMKGVGAIGLKAIVYFEVVTTCCAPDRAGSRAGRAAWPRHSRERRDARSVRR